MSNINPLLPSYEDLKLEISRYVAQEEINFNEKINQLKKFRFPNNFNNSYDGKIFPTKRCGPIQVIEYFNYDSIAVVFLNSGYKSIVRANNLNRGEVKDPYAISILGVGYIGVGPYSIDKTPFDRMIYSRWRGIIDRCYVKKEGRKYMNSEWFNFQYFSAWFHSEFYIIPYCDMYGMCVDKDILCARNEEYGPNKCLIIPNFINSKIQLKEYDRLQINRFFASEMSPYEIMRLMRRKSEREEAIRNLADEYKNILPLHVYMALKSYTMF